MSLSSHGFLPAGGYSGEFSERFECALCNGIATMTSLHRILMHPSYNGKRVGCDTRPYVCKRICVFVAFVTGVLPTPSPPATPPTTPSPPVVAMSASGMFSDKS